MLSPLNIRVTYSAHRIVIIIIILWLHLVSTARGNNENGRTWALSARFYTVCSYTCELLNYCTYNIIYRVS